VRPLHPIALNNCSRGSDMNWLRNRFDPRFETSLPGEESLVRLAEAGTEVVLFVPASAAGRVCEMARLLEGGRIPIKLAEATPLAGCTNREDCACRYETWPHRSSSSDER